MQHFSILLVSLSIDTTLKCLMFDCVYQSYCLVSQYYWIVYTNHIVWSLSTTGLCIPIILFGLSVLLDCVYQSYCFVSQYYWIVYTNHIVWSLSTTGLRSPGFLAKIIANLQVFTIFKLRGL